MYRLFALALTLIVLTSALGGCSRSQRPVELQTERLDNVVQVMLRESGSYTLFVQNPETSEIQMRPLRVKNVNMKIIADVPPEKNGWLITKRGFYRENKRAIWEAELHIHSVSDLGAAGYRVPSGKTSRPVQPQMMQ